MFVAVLKQIFISLCGWFSCISSSERPWLWKGRVDLGHPWNPRANDVEEGGMRGEIDGARKVTILEPLPRVQNAKLKERPGRPDKIKDIKMQRIFIQCEEGYSWEWERVLI